MFRKLIVLFGVVEALYPEQVMVVFGKLGFRTEGKAEPRSWLVTAARIEGVLIALGGTIGLLAYRYGRMKEKKTMAKKSVDEDGEREEAA